MVLVTFGGAGGTLDEDRVEDWGFVEKSVRGRYHFGWLTASFTGLVIDGEGEKRREEPASFKALDGEVEKQKRGGSQPPRVFQSMRVGRCGVGQEAVRDAVEWRAVDVDGKELDRVWLVGNGCL
jgi:hypothetical protein